MMICRKKKKFNVKTIDTIKIITEVVKSSSLISLNREMINKVTQNPINGFNIKIAIGGINALIKIPINNHNTIIRNRRYLFFLSFEIPLKLILNTKL